MIRIITERDEFDTPLKWYDVPSADLDRLSPRLADQFDRECAEVEAFGIRSYGEAVWKIGRIRRGYLERLSAFNGNLKGEARKAAAVAAEDAADEWLVQQRDTRDVGVASAWAALAKAGVPVHLREIYDGDLDYVETPDPMPVPKQPQDHQGKAKAGSRTRRSDPA